MFSGKELKIKRILLGIKAKEIAECLNVGSSYISKLENEVQDIPVHIYKRWVEFLGLNNMEVN